MIKEFKFYKGFKKTLNPFFPIFINKSKLSIDFIINKYQKNSDGYNLLFGFKNSKNCIKVYFINNSDTIDLYINFDNAEYYKLIGTIEFDRFNNLQILGLKNDDLHFILNNNMLFNYPNYFLKTKIILGMKPKLIEKTKNSFSIFINYFLDSEKNILNKRSKLIYWKKFSFSY